MISALARWVAVAVILATGAAGSALIAADIGSTSTYRNRGALMVLGAAGASFVYAVTSFLL